MVQEPGGKIDSAHVTFRQGIMYKPDIVKPGITALDCLLPADPQVIELAHRGEPFFISHTRLFPLYCCPAGAGSCKKVADPRDMEYL